MGSGDRQQVDPDHDEIRETVLAGLGNPLGLAKSLSEQGLTLSS
jgi:hypothetical protein